MLIDTNKRYYKRSLVHQEGGRLISTERKTFTGAEIVQQIDVLSRQADVYANAIAAMKDMVAEASIIKPTCHYIYWTSHTHDPKRGYRYAGVDLAVAVESINTGDIMAAELHQCYSSVSSVDEMRKLVVGNNGTVLNKSTFEIVLCDCNGALYEFKEA